MSKLFISYRRDDTADICGRIDDKLAARFGRPNVFKDVDSIPLGADFRTILRDTVNQCAAMLVVIGRRWVDMTDEHGRRRLESPGDFVRIEVEAALARGIPVIPVLVQGAMVPREEQLPTSMAELAYRHGTDVRGDPHFHRDVDQLMERLAPLLQASVGARPAAPAPAPPVSLPRAGEGSGVGSLPARLAQLGFVARKSGSVEYIVPPVVSVPAGEFLVGSDPQKDSGAYDEEKPQHRVTLPSFQIARYPVTLAEYACFVRGGHAEPKSQHNSLTWKTQLEQRLDHPVVNVSWRDVVDYAAWLKQQTGQPWRLPSEAEWEKAARGTDGRIYPWGNQWDKTRANTSDGGPKTTSPVGAYAEHGDASPYGVHDLAGNVWEWTSTLWKSYPYSVIDGREALTSTGNRALRGGSWDSNPRFARAAFRLSDRPDNAVGYGGFRLALAVPNSV